MDVYNHLCEIFHHSEGERVAILSLFSFQFHMWKCVERYFPHCFKSKITWKKKEMI